jgi:aldehyde dehydrogenase (NAD+)
MKQQLTISVPKDYSAVTLSKYLAFKEDLESYKDEEDAIAQANDSDYGLSGYVWGQLEDARRVARRLRTGMVHINGAGMDFNAPFGGYRQSGNGREWGLEGFEEFLETKALVGFGV